MMTFFVIIKNVNNAIVAKPASSSTPASSHVRKPESRRQPIQFYAASVFGEDFESTVMLDEAFDDIYNDVQWRQLALAAGS